MVWGTGANTGEEVRVGHLERSTCHAISSRGGQVICGPGGIEARPSSLPSAPVLGLEFGVQGLGLRVSRLGFGVEG